MYDLMNRIYTDIVIQPARTENEHAAFCEMVDGYNGSKKRYLLLTVAMNLTTTLLM